MKKNFTLGISSLFGQYAIDYLKQSPCRRAFPGWFPGSPPHCQGHPSRILQRKGRPQVGGASGLKSLRCSSRVLLILCGVLCLPVTPPSLPVLHY